MTIREKYTLEINQILQDIDKLKQNQIYEIDRVPGVAKCSTLGRELEEKFLALLAKIENDAAGDIENAAEILR